MPVQCPTPSGPQDPSNDMYKKVCDKAREFYDEIQSLIQMKFAMARAARAVAGNGPAGGAPGANDTLPAGRSWRAASLAPWPSKPADPMAYI